MRKHSIVLTVLLSVLLAFVACDNSIDIGLDTKVDPYKTPLTLEFLEDGTFQVDYYYYHDSSTVLTIEYSINGGERVEFEKGHQAIDVYEGDIVCFYRDVVGVKSIPYYSRIQCSSPCYVYGNVMSLIDSMNFATEKNVHGDSLMGLFYGNTNIKNHKEIDLVLPATQLAVGCYASMFQGCTGLTRAPELPATELAEHCYENMFRNCASLTTAPDLPATQLAGGCYASMFTDCTGLTRAPELPADTLAYSCYRCMFSGCTSLTTAPVLSAKTLAISCYLGMFQGCTSLTTAPVLPAKTLANSCYYGMFEGCTSLTTAPVLPAETLADFCYFHMFYNCLSLNSITCLATHISASECTTNWVSGVAPTGTFTKHNTAVWTKGNNGYPTGWTLKDYYN